MRKLILLIIITAILTGCSQTTPPGRNGNREEAAAAHPTDEPASVENRNNSPEGKEAAKVLPGIPKLNVSEINIEVYGVSRTVKPGEKVVYSGRTSARFLFDDAVDAELLKKSIRLEPAFNPNQIAFGTTDSGKTWVYFNLLDVQGPNAPEHYSITLAEGLKSKSGKALAEDVAVHFTRKEHPITTITLLDGKVRQPYNVYLSDADQTFLLEFSKEMNRQSVEKAIKEGIYPEYSDAARSGTAKPGFAFSWKDGKTLHLSLTSLKPERWYEINLTGALDSEACQVWESPVAADPNLNTVYDRYRFLTGKKQRIFSYDPATGKEEILAEPGTQRYHGGSLSFDGTWASLGRFTSLEGDLYMHLPVFLNLKTGQKVEMKDTTTFEDVIWLKNSNRVLLRKAVLFDPQTEKSRAVFTVKDSWPVGARVSPDEKQAAIFDVEQRDQVNLLITDMEGKIVKNIPMPFYHEREADGTYLKPLTFEWIGSDTLVSEGWTKNYQQGSVYKITVSTGKVEKLMELAYHPVVSPKGGKIAVVKQQSKGSSVKKPGDLLLTDMNGRELGKIKLASINPEGYRVSQIRWSPDGTKLYIGNTGGQGYGKDNRKYMFFYDTVTGENRRYNIDKTEDFSVLGISADGKKLICTNQEELPKQ